MIDGAQDAKSEVLVETTEGDMMKEDAFNAAKAAFSLYGGFFKDMAEEVGLEKAVSLHAKQSAAFDALLVGMIKERLGDGEIDLGTFASVRSEALAALGMTTQIGEAPNLLTLGVQRCPLYEGLRMAGLEHATIEEMCRQGTVLGYAEFNTAFPRLSGCLKFRPVADQPCVEEFALSPKPDS